MAGAINDFRVYFLLSCSHVTYRHVQNTGQFLLTSQYYDVISIKGQCDVIKNVTWPN